MISKLGLPTDRRLALIKNQTSDLLFYGKVNTTLARAKSVISYVSKIITLAIKTYKDQIIVDKIINDNKNNKITIKVMKDGVHRLNARRKIISLISNKKLIQSKNESKAEYKIKLLKTKNPIVKKVFEIYAPMYDIKKCTSYTNIVKLGSRLGDNAQKVQISMLDFKTNNN